jgi:hypothetical protein
VQIRGPSAWACCRTHFLEQLQLLPAAALTIMLVSPVGAQPLAQATGVPSVQGCDFNGAGAAFTTLMYFQEDASFVYDSLRSTAEPNGVQPVPGLRNRAFIYVGADGPGVVVAKGDKLFALEFSGIGSGAAEESSLLTLAQQAVNRVQST